MRIYIKPRSENGMALVITLAAVVLLTVLVTAFFSRSLLNRQISYSSTSLTKADFVAHSALDIITGEVRNEIVNPARSTVLGTKPYYVPKSTADVIPSSAGLSSASGSLVKVSASGIPFAPGSSLTGSPVSTGTPSKNGRSFSASRWFTSTGSPRLGSNSVVPDWVFLTRENGVKTPVIADAKNRTGPDSVVGRFAYCVYDIGGLLDANVAGYPASASANAPFKPSAAYADLGALGLNSPMAFVSWRNASSGVDAATFQEWASGVSRATGTANGSALAAVRSGYRSSALGDNAVFSRRDLLANPHLGGAQNLLTHFTRSLNSPTPSTSSPTSTNDGSIIHYLDDGSTETYGVSVGDLLLQRRFSLAKLGWLTAAGPKPGISAAQIQACFGLHWNDSDAANKYWEYVGPSGSTIQSQIKTLAAVAAENPAREPNFFEYLKAGIVAGSVGRASVNRTLALGEQMIREGVADLQILRIGANVLDSADEDNYPTTIVLNYGGLDVPVHGVEDLPYLYGLVYGRIGDSTQIDDTYSVLNHCSLMMAPILFNPHAASTAASGQSPTAIRVRIAGGSFSTVYWPPLGPAAGTPLARSVVYPESDLTTRPAIVVPSSAYESFRSNMSVIRGANATSPTRLGLLDSYINATDADAHGFLYYAYTGLPETYVTGTTGGPITSRQSNLFIVLEYQDSNGAWHIYDSLAGNEAFTQTGLSEGSSSNPYLGFGPGINPIGTNGKTKGVNALGFAAMKFDPRTTRFGVGRSGTWWTTVTRPMPESTFKGMGDSLPFGTGGTVNSASMPGGIYPGLWAEGGKTSWTGSDGLLITNVSDADGVTRPADAWLNGASANLFRDYTETPRRPVIPQHPFRTLGELGYVFRDSPWKTLSFFDESSGDGALLELFAVADQPALTAGRVNLNSRQSLTQKALLSGSGQNFDGSNPLAAPDALATAYQTFALSAGIPTTNLPVSLGDLPKFLSSSDLNASFPTSTNPIKNRREAVVRALAGSSQTRTWNLLIDVVAQTGKYSAAATSLEQFIVEGQKRYWLSLAIDRYTGKIITQQLEPIYE